MDASAFLVQVLTGLASASGLFLVSCGLTIIFGVSRIVNFAHGSFSMLGAYVAGSLTGPLMAALGRPVRRSHAVRPTAPGGEQQMLAVARALMGNPHLLLLDEPSEGIAPIIVDQIVAVVRAWKAVGLPILLTEQNLGLALEVADRADVIERGSVRYAGPVDDLVRDPAPAEIHLAL